MIPYLNDASDVNNNNNSNPNEKTRLFSSSESTESFVACGPELRADIWKLLFTAVYYFVVLYCHSLILVYANERLPPSYKDQPLPDLFFQLFNYVPESFRYAEIIIMFFLCCFAVLLLFHKSRLILLRRFLVIHATAFLLRSITVIATTLPVPSTRINCRVITITHPLERFAIAFGILFGGGMSINGVQTCGDYIYSGHTVTVTLLNMMIVEYTPFKMLPFHIITWILNISSIILILLSRQHYSVDVVLGYFIATRLFYTYHHFSFYLSRAVQRAKCSLILCFPLMYFLENHTTAPIENEYEIPFKNQVIYLVQLCKQKIRGQSSAGFANGTNNEGYASDLTDNTTNPGGRVVTMAEPYSPDMLLVQRQDRKSVV